jgi:hypothetical protein
MSPKSLRRARNAAGSSGLTAVALAVVLSASILGHQTSTGVYTFAPVANGMQLRTPNGRVVFEYLTKKPSDSALTSPSVACFHPLNTPSGERISALAPDDHLHHRGMYLAWHDSEFRQPVNTEKNGPTGPLFGWSITKADFWGWGVYAPRDGRVIQTTDVKLLIGTSDRAQIEIHNDWIVGKRKMLDEVTQATVSERDGVYVIDLNFRLAPVVDYVLNRQSFSGFNLQARKDGESYYTNAAGQVTLRDPHYSAPELNWPAAPWYGYVIKLQDGKTIGAAVIDHPLNPPSTWHNSRTLWMLNPNIAAQGPFTIRPDAPLTLRYRVVAHDGPTPTAIVQKLSEEWRGVK